MFTVSNKKNIFLKMYIIVFRTNFVLVNQISVYLFESIKIIIIFLNTKCIFKYVFKYVITNINGINQS